MSARPQTQGHDDLAQARRWIGQRLELREPFNGFPAGTRCVVMCVVDFGDGLLLWVITDDPRLEEVDQVSLDEVSTRFHLRSGGHSQPLPALDAHAARV